MAKVTVLYNLQPGSDEEEFVKWRTTTHHAANIARPDVIPSDFYRIIGLAGVGDIHPASDKAPYRFITESRWENFEAFNAAWNNPEEQSRLIPAFAKISDTLALISEEMQTYT